jgi:phosphoribosylanthranilate isomerase
MLAIKICGLTSWDDARCAVEEGATHLGFVFYRGSPRWVSPEQVQAIVDRIPADVRAVGVFVNERPSVVREVARLCRLHAVQLHGDEDPALFSDLPTMVWRAVRLKEGAWTPDPANWSPELFVMDAPSAAYGGSGIRVDTDAAACFAREHRALLAGGLDASNVGEAIINVRPAGVDVSSGVELTPGKKDHRKVADFVRAARVAMQTMEPAKP